MGLLRFSIAAPVSGASPDASSSPLPAFSAFPPAVQTSPPASWFCWTDLLGEAWTASEPRELLDADRLAAALLLCSALWLLLFALMGLSTTATRTGPAVGLLAPSAASCFLETARFISTGAALL